MNKYGDQKNHNNLKMDTVFSMMQEARVNISERDLQMCYSLSKMTIVRESSYDFQKYFYLVTVEFLEFIARVADCSFQEGDGLTLVTKIEDLMDQLFCLVTWKRQGKAETSD